MVFGFIVFRGYCRGEYLSKFLASSISLLLFKTINRSMSCAPYHGQWLHCIRHDHGHHTAGWRAMGSSKWTKSRMVGFLVRSLICLALILSKILLEKGNHSLGMYIIKITLLYL